MKCSTKAMIDNGISKWISNEDISVSVMTRLQAGQSGGKSWQGQKCFLCSRGLEALGPTQPPIQWFIGYWDKFGGAWSWPLTSIQCWSAAVVSIVILSSLPLSLSSSVLSLLLLLPFQFFHFYDGTSAQFQAMAYLIFFLQASITVSIINQTKLTTSHSCIYLTITTHKLAHDKNSTNKNT